MSAPTTLSRPHPTVWQISLSSPPDNRLTPTLLASLDANLDIVEAEWRRSGGGVSLEPKKRGEHGGAGALIITSSIGKFFSNGLDYEKSSKDNNFFPETFDPVVYRLMTFPLITIAAINGHAFAGGMVLALSCDYRLITSGKGLLCMNEVTFGAPLPPSFSAILSLRIPHPQHLRDTLIAKRWTQPELLKIGLVDEVVYGGSLVNQAVEMGLKLGPMIGAGSWGGIKDGSYHSVLDASKSRRPVIRPNEEAKAFWALLEGKKVKAKL